MKQFLSFLKSADRATAAYKKGVAINVLIICGVLLAFILYVSEATPKLKAKEDIIGQVISVHPMKDDTRRYGWLIEVELEDDKRTRLLINRQPIPEVGEHIPLIKEIYDNGEVLINLASGPY